MIEIDIKKHNEKIKEEARKRKERRDKLDQQVNGSVSIGEITTLNNVANKPTSGKRTIAGK